MNDWSLRSKRLQQCLFALLPMAAGVLHGCDEVKRSEPKTTEPKMTKAETLSAKIKCAEVARKYFENDERALPKGAKITYFEFAYNEHRNTCVYNTLYVDPDTSTSLIIDLLTNVTLAHYPAVKPGQASAEEIQAQVDYLNKHMELFGE